MPPTTDNSSNSILTYISPDLNTEAVHALDVLGDPIRRRILELLADGERTAGSLAEVINAEFGISQPAVSQHLRVLRESGFARVRAEGTKRLYEIDGTALREVDGWLARFERFRFERFRDERPGAGAADPA